MNCEDVKTSGAIVPICNSRELVVDAYYFPDDVAVKLRPDDEIMKLYNRVKGTFGDSMELETLAISVEEILGRSLTSDEKTRTQTIGDIAHLLQSRDTTSPNHRQSELE